MDYNKKLEELKAWMDSPEGEAAFDRWAEKIKAEDERYDRWIQYIHDNYRDRLDEVIQKLIDKYGSAEYINREYSLGYEPREKLLWILSTYANNYGTEFTQEEFNKYRGMFTGSMYYLGDWVFEIIHGQGSALLVYRKSELKEASI
jgi:hypothetical protein